MRGLRQNSDKVMRDGIKTPETHPDHPVVGRHWGAHSIKTDRTAIYFCESYDPQAGFWMTNIHDKSDRTCISERAPMRTWWPAEDRDHYWYIWQWRVGISKRDGERVAITYENG